MEIQSEDVIVTDESSGAVLVYRRNPNKERLIPPDPGLPAVAYPRKSSGLVYVWNLLHREWRELPHQRPHPLVLHILTGNLNKMNGDWMWNVPASVWKLAVTKPDHKIRLKAAATVAAWLDGRLDRRGGLFDERHHARRNRMPS